MIRRVVALLLVVSLAAGCGLPERRSDTDLTKPSVSLSEAERILERYRKVHRTAFDVLNAGPLTTVEAGPVLKIDAGGIKERRILGDDGSQASIGGAELDLVDVYAPTFAEYPLWFIAVVRDQDRELTRLQVYSRATAATPWTLVASPEVESADVVPELERDTDGRPVRLDPEEQMGLVSTPQSAAESYVGLLAGERPDDVERDSFVQQMRDAARSASSIDKVRYQQSWKTHGVKYALRTADGGALVFATLTRDEDYRVNDGVFVNWPNGSQQQAFLPKKLFGHGKLRYYHQMLLYVPAEDDGAIRALGQYGGIIDGDGY